MGAETFLGALALRVGLNTLSDIQQFTMGTGFQFQNIKLDYSFGVVTSGSVNSVHKITFSQRFGQSRTAQREMSSNLKIDQSDGRTVFEIKQDSSNPAFSLSDTTSQLYKLKDGETLESIALSRYGSAAQWVHIYEINRYMYSSPDKIKAGCRILLPVKKNP